MNVTCDKIWYCNGFGIVFSIFPLHSSVSIHPYTHVFRVNTPIYARFQGKNFVCKFLFHIFARQSEAPTIPNVSSCISPQNAFEFAEKGLNPKFRTGKLTMRYQNVNLPHLKVEPILPTSRSLFMGLNLNI